MTRNTHLFYSILVVLVLAACSSEKKKKKNQDSQKTKKVQAIIRNGISLLEIDNTDDIGILKIENIETSNSLNVAGIDINYSLQKFVLGAQSKEIDKKNTINSKKGQSLGIIVNNGKPKHIYSDSLNSIKSSRNSDCLVFTYLTKSNGVGLKNNDAYDLNYIGNQDSVDLTAPRLIMVQPARNSKVKFKQKDKVLLDFYPLNIVIGEEDYKIRMKIDSTTFTLDKWAPYRIMGLNPGKHSISLKLINQRKSSSKEKLEIVKHNFVISEE
ncbi:MAG: hypothetical protein JXQ90_05220 [Cyclobacteriaceae bacterium]